MPSDRTLIIWALVILVVAGGGILWIFFDPITALLGVAIMFIAFAGLAGLYGLLRLLEMWAQRGDDD